MGPNVVNPLRQQVGKGIDQFPLDTSDIGDQGPRAEVGNDLTENFRHAANGGREHDQIGALRHLGGSADFIDDPRGSGLAQGFLATARRHDRTGDPGPARGHGDRATQESQPQHRDAFELSAQGSASAPGVARKR